MILAILQARVSSSRLPAKVLKPILGVPMFVRQLERIRRSKRIDRVLVATSTEPSDDAIEKLSMENDVDCFRGNLNDVLERFYHASLLAKPDHIVRLTADCPLADPDLIDRVIEFYLNGHYDYASNTIKPTFPDGLDVEVFRFSCLSQAWLGAKLPSEREHVTSFIYKQPDRFKVGCFKNDTDLSGLRWTVDEALDFELITKIYQALYPFNPNFTTSDILTYLDENPELKDLNLKYMRNEGFQKSLREDNFSRSTKGISDVTPL